MANMIRATSEATAVTLSNKFGIFLPNNIINKDIIYSPDSLALRFRAEKSDRKKVLNPEEKLEPTDKYLLEFINFWVTKMEFSWDRQRTAVAHSGIEVEYKNLTAGGKEYIALYKAVPLDMFYTMTFWTANKEKMDDFIQEFSFWPHENPNIDLFYDDNKSLSLDLLIEPMMVTDDTTITNQFEKGKYWKTSFSFKVESWMLKGEAVRTAKTIYLDIYAPDVGIDPGPEETKVYEGVIDETTP